MKKLCLLIVIAFLISCGNESEKSLIDINEYVQIGTNLYEKDSFAAAIQILSKVLEFEESNETALYYRAKSYNNLKKSDLALIDLQKILKLNSIKSNEYLASIFNQMGVAKANLMYYEVAITIFSQAIMLNPKVYYYYTNRGRCHFEKSPPDLNSACLDYSFAIMLNPAIAEEEIVSLCENY